VTEHAGDSGKALWRTQNFGAIHVRMVEYSPGYKADHWCANGHVLLCLEANWKRAWLTGGHLHSSRG